MKDITAIKIISSLEKIYKEDKLPLKELQQFSMLKNEKKSFQVAIEGECEKEVGFSLCSDLKNISVSLVEHVKSDFPMSKTGAHSITFREYPHDDEWLMNTRERVNMRIKQELDGRVKA